MKYHLETVAFTSQKNVIEKHGDTIWDVICDEVMSKHWTMGEAVAAVKRELGFAHRTATDYTRAVIRNVMLESPGEVIIRRGARYEWV